jgi:peptidoglycan/xylan/chitin deacetylase (PgdA/CDA1 family)
MNKLLLTLFLVVVSASEISAQKVIDKFGAIVRSDTSKQTVYLCFTGHDFNEGFDHVLKTLEKQQVLASFFLTGDFVRKHRKLTKRITKDEHYVGAHSDKHLLYCDWEERDSLLHSPDEIRADIQDNILELNQLGIYPNFFMPPYEWYNAEVVKITVEVNQRTVNFTHGIRSNADYTTPGMKNYIDSDAILKSIYDYEFKNGMNGFHLLIHPGTNPKRTDKLYLHLDKLISYLKNNGYSFNKFDR